MIAQAEKEGVSSYFDSYSGTEPVTKFYEPDNRIFRVYFGETGEEGYADTFHLVVVSVGDFVP